MDDVSANTEVNKATGKLPGTARVVVIGGGSVGASVLYHLAEKGWTDVVLLEKNELTSGSTWHAAGNCPNFVGSWTMMKIQSYSTSLYRELGAKVDYPMNYHVTGAIRLAHSRQRMEEFRHVERMGRQMGVEFQEMSPSEMQEVYPFLETHDLYGGQWDPLDGDIDPAQLTQALAKGARDMGARIIRFCPVTGVRRENGEWVLSTPQGEIRCEYVVNATGYRANEVGAMFGRNVPCVSLAHQYLITEGIPELAERDRKLPLLRDPDSSYYLRQEKDGLLLGPYEKNCRAHWTTADDPMPEDFSFQLYSDDLERLEWYIEDACARVPLLGTAGITRVVNGPIPYAPDGLPLIGPMPGVPNAFEACVFTFGIVQAGGAGKLLSDIIVEGESETDSWAVDPRRFTDHVDLEYTKAKAIETYSHEYAMHFPQIQWPAGRNAKVSPLYDRLADAGAAFGSYGGWERADWFPRDGESEHAADSYDRQPWFDAVGADVAVVAIELRRAGHSEPASAQAACHDLRALIQQADPRRALHAGFIVQVHRDRITLDRIHVDAIAHQLRDMPAAHARADDHRIGGKVLNDIRRTGGKAVIQRGLQQEADAAFSGLHIAHIHALHEAHAAPFAGLREAPRELVDVTGGVGFGEVAAVVVAA